MLERKSVQATRVMRLFNLSLKRSEPGLKEILCMGQYLEARDNQMAFDSTGITPP